MPVVNELYSGFLWPLLSALAGAAAGSISAYKLNSLQIKSDERRREIGTIAQVIFDMEQLLNDILTAKKQLIIPYNFETFRFLEIPPVHGDFHYIDAKANPELASVVINYKNPDLASLVNISIKRYRSYVSQSKLRAELYREAFNILGEKHKKLTTINISNLADAIGTNRVLAMYLSTENYIKTIDDAAASIFSALSSLIEFLEKEFINEYNSINLINKDQVNDLLQPASDSLLSERDLLMHCNSMNYEQNNYYLKEITYKVYFYGTFKG